MRTLMILAAVAMFVAMLGLSVVGCKAEGEIGDVSSSVPAAR